MSDKAKLIFDGKEHLFDVVKGSESEKALDVSSLRSDLDLITIDRCGICFLILLKIETH